MVKIVGNVLRTRMIESLCHALEPLPYVEAGWEGGSAAFGLVDAYSDIDLNFVLSDAIHIESFYAVVQSTLEAISPVVAIHPEPPGRYFKLADGGEFLLVDVCVFQVETYSEYLDEERHGKMLPLFDKGQWLCIGSPDTTLMAVRRERRRVELEEWFSTSQSFVRKAIFRGQEIEALAAFWGYTVRPLVELLRMRYCPVRWDFGMRYLQRDLPGSVYNELREIMYVGEPAGLELRFDKAVTWGERLIRELSP